MLRNLNLAEGGIRILGVPTVGIAAETIAADTAAGDNGAGILYNESIQAGYAGKQLRAVVTSTPAVGTVFVAENGLVTATGLADGPNTIGYNLYVDGDYDSATTATILVGATTHVTTGALVASAATVAGTAARVSGAVTHETTGALVAQAATIAGTAARAAGTVTHVTTGALVAQAATLDGTSARIAAPVTHVTSGALVAQAATVRGRSFNNVPFTAEQLAFMLIYMEDNVATPEQIAAAVLAQLKAAGMLTVPTFLALK